MIDFRVKKAHTEYEKHPNDKTLRCFNKILNKTYSTKNDRSYIKNKLNFKLL